MDQKARRDVPTHPKLRLLQPQLVEYQGRRMIYFEDELGIAKEGALIPQQLGPLLALCDGTRDLAGLRSGLLMRTGASLPEDVIRDIVGQLDEALLLENGAFRQAAADYMRGYRRAKHREPAHAGAVYPRSAAQLRALLEGYCARADAGGANKQLQHLQKGYCARADAGADGDNVQNGAAEGELVGMLCPHIDYARGNQTYAALWNRAKPHLDDVELAFIFGTDHSGGLGAVTPTRQNYATPLGTLQTDTAIVDGLADALGQGRAYAEEIHHIREHSIELAAVWLHRFMEGREFAVAPVLCGSFHHFITGKGSPSDDEGIVAALAFLREATAGRRTLAIAAGDLAHMGPTFGDPQPLDAGARARLRADDEGSIGDILAGDADGFLERSRRERDARRICGLSPIYLMLKYLEGRRLQGESMGYDQCAADAEGGSVVSIAGTLLYGS